MSEEAKVSPVEQFKVGAASISAAKFPKNWSIRMTFSEKAASSCSSTTASTSKTIATSAARTGKVFLHGPHQDSGRKAHQRPAAGGARFVRRSGQRHAADHHPPGPAVARRSETRPPADDRPDQRSPAHHDRRLRRRRTQRHVLAVPFKGDSVHRQMQALADRIAVHFCPRTSAYHELWLTDPETGEKELVSGASGQEVEPIYGKTYLPRKFKTAIGLPGDNSVDMYTNDLGFLAICEEFGIVRLQRAGRRRLWRHSVREENLPARRQAAGFVTPDQVDRRRHRDREGTTRFRQPRRPQSRTPEVPDPRLGPGGIQGQGRGVLWSIAETAAPKHRSLDFMTAWAGTNRATEDGSMG